MTGETISHFKVIDKLGGGGMGVVYVAEDLHLDRRVALKFLPPHLNTDRDAKQRFIQEAKAASALNHPAICTIHDIDEAEDGQLFIAMALYEGETLKQKITSGPLAPEEAADIARQLAEGLAEAHDHGIVHRDIKPANIFVAKGNRAVILDFGLVKLTDSVDLTKSGMTLGTAHYMSPEQIRAEPVDHRTDIWSLGVVLYEMIAGRRPFDGDYEQAISYSILNEEPDTLPPEAESLQDVVTGCLTKEKSERLPDAETLAKRLRPAVATTAERVFRETGSSRRNRVPWLVSAAAVAILLIGAFFLTRQRAPEAKEANVRQGLAVFPFSVAGDPELDYLGEGMVDLLSTALDGAGDIRAVDPYLVIGEVHRSGEDALDPVAALSMVGRLGARSFVLGNVLKVGQQIRLSAAHYDESGDVLARAEGQIGSEDGLLEELDGLAQRLLAGTVAAEDQGRLSLAVATTESIDALKAYLRGEKALREGRYQDAKDEMLRATDEDSTFALAWYRLGHAEGWLDNAVDGARYSLQAADLATSLPDRQRRLVLAEASGYKGDFETSLRLYQELTREYPGDAHAWMRLGDAFFHQGLTAGLSRLRGVEPLERAFTLDPDNAEALLHLIEAAIWTQQFSRADSLIGHYVQGSQRRVFELRTQLAQTTVTSTRDSLVAAAIADVPDRVHWIAHQARGRNRHGDPFTPSADDFEEGERFYRFAGDRWEWREVAYRFVRSGRAEEALEFFEGQAGTLAYLAFSPVSAVFEDRLSEIREAILANPFQFRGWRWQGQEPVYVAFIAGLLSAKVGEWDEVEQHSRTLARRTEIDGPDSFAAGFGKTLEAFLAWKDGNLDLTEALLSEVRVPYSGIQGGWDGRVADRQLRATVLMEQRRYAEALEVWESLAQSHFIYTIPSYLYRGRCYEGMGRPHKAIALYSALIDIWKDADLELQPMVEEARAGLERLLDAEVREPS